MKKCSTCNKRIAFGGEAFGNEIYCGDRCRKIGLLQASKDYLTEEFILSRLEDIHHGLCPKCGGQGPNDMQWHYTIWSIIVLTYHEDVPEVCCRKCGFKKKTIGFFFSALFGWWGFPLGILLTPIQLIRNFISFFRIPQEGVISKQMDEEVRLELGAEVLFEKAKIQIEEEGVGNAR